MFNQIKKKLVGFVAIMAAFFSLSAFAAGQVLILYDSSGPFATLGKEYSMMLQNLLGHFDVTVTSKPAIQYAAGEMNGKLATFYIGSTYDEPSYYAPTAQQYINYNNFLADTATTNNTVVWLNYNLWKLAWSWNPAWGTGFTDKFGIAFSGLVNNNYNRVKYKATDLLKGVVKWGFPGAALTGCISEGASSTKSDCALEVNQISVVDPAKATVYATTYSTLNSTGVETPYITKAQNLWLVGDIPFMFFSEEDRYLAMADILHDILGSQVAEKHIAMVRLEDVGPDYDPAVLKQVTDYLNSQSIPFSVAAIPHYMDPLGANNNGVPENIRMINSNPIATALRNLVAQKRASIIQHGTTHQFGRLLNPFNGVSGDDFEFFRVILNADNSLTFVGPVPNDSATWAQTRIINGRNILTLGGLKAFAWEAPHYTASATDYTAIKALYPVHYGRMTYFDGTRRIGQFYPYLINSDAYGYKVIPENLGNVEPEAFLGYPLVFPADLVSNAKAALVVRDGTASFFYHPFLGVSYLKQVVDGLKGLGYTFVAPCSLVNGC